MVAGERRWSGDLPAGGAELPWPDGSRGRRLADCTGRESEREREREREGGEERRGEEREER